MSDWIVVVTESSQLWNAKCYGPFGSEEVAKALAQGLQSGVGGKTAMAVRMEKP